MKIAIAKDGSAVSGHFGHCEGYAIYEVNNSMFINAGSIDNPGHQPGFLPVFLAEHGVNVIIAGGMGQRAVDLFSQQGIKVVLGASGPVDLVAQDFHSGKLVPTTEGVCQNHDHECSGH